MKIVSSILLLSACFFSHNLSAEQIVFISDMNGRYGNTQYDSRVSDAVSSILALQPDMVVSTGDMVAGQKSALDSDQLDQMWASFNRTVTQPLEKAGIPFIVTPGNHDGSAYKQFALEREHFQAQWDARIPELEILPGSEWPRRYAALAGSTLLLSFDGTRPGKLPKSEIEFVENMLKTYADGPELTIVFSHLPMWPMAKGRESQIIDDPDLLGLLHDYGVDVYASGHHHAFYAGTDDAGMIHLGLGALGGNARAFSGHNHRQPFSFAVLSLQDKEISIKSLMAPDFEHPVPDENMPETVEGPLGTLQRLTGSVSVLPIAAGN